MLIQVFALIIAAQILQPPPKPVFKMAGKNGSQIVLQPVYPPMTLGVRQLEGPELLKSQTTACDLKNKKTKVRLSNGDEANMTFLELHCSDGAVFQIEGLIF